MITPDEWESIALLIEEGWPGEFTDASAAAWRVFLDDYDAERVLTALKVLVARGGRFRPSVAEVAAEINVDRCVPTFIEAYQLIYGARGVLAARPKQSWWDTPAQRERSYEDAARERAAEMHPLIGRFIDRYGVNRLRMLELDDPEFGALRRRELQADYEQLTEALEGRRLEAIAAPRRNGGLARIGDPLEALGIERPAAITSGGDE